MTAKDAAWIIEFSSDVIWNDASDETREAIIMALKSLEKQIPMKIEDEGEITCGSCGAVLSGDDWFDYCPWCGQAIDWYGN